MPSRRTAPTRAKVVPSLLVLVVGVLASGCSSILGVDLDGLKGGADGGLSGGDDGGDDGDGGGVPPNPDGSCNADRKRCGELCVSVLDPAFGCSATTCSPCSLPFGVAACVAGACAFGGCERGRASCDEDNGNGCEVDTLTDVKHCGGCDKGCSSGRLCSAGTCAETCATGYVRVGAVCVDEAFVDPIVAGGEHGCRIDAANKVVCWGSNTDGEATPPAGSLFKQLSAGNHITCGLRLDDTLQCWGKIQALDPILPRQEQAPAGTYKQVSVGFDHACAIRSDGVIVCWGSDRYSQSSPPGGVFKKVSGGGGHTCAIKSDDTVTCWGSNDDNQLGPIASGAATPFQSISAASRYTCGIRKADRKLECWGSTTLPSVVSSAPAIKHIGRSHFKSCVILSNDSVECWGTHASSTTQRFRLVNAGWDSACGILLDGSPYCWNVDGVMSIP